MSADTQDNNRPLDAVVVGGAAAFKQLVSKMILRLNGITDVMVRSALLEAGSEFCGETEAWREVTCLCPAMYCGCCGTGSEVEWEPGTAADFRFPVPASCYAKTVFQVSLDGRVIPSRSWSLRNGCGNCGGTVINISGAWLPLEQEAWKGLRVAFSVVPEDTIEELPRELMVKYGNVITSGALFSLFAMERKPWSDSTQAQIELGKWNAGKNRASYEGITSLKAGPLDQTTDRRADIRNRSQGFGRSF